MAQPERSTLQIPKPVKGGLILLILLLGLCTASMCQAASHAQAQAAVRVRDFEKAAQLYLEMAKAGDKEAQFALGNLYRSGRGVKKDHRRAFVWLSKAAEQGHVKAQYTTGTLYENDWGGGKGGYGQGENLVHACRRRWQQDGGQKAGTSRHFLAFARSRQ
jgi:TPR repeat protein